MRQSNFAVINVDTVLVQQFRGRINVEIWLYEAFAVSKCAINVDSCSYERFAVFDINVVLVFSRSLYQLSTFIPHFTACGLHNVDALRNNVDVEFERDIFFMSRDCVLGVHVSLFCDVHGPVKTLVISQSSMKLEPSLGWIHACIVPLLQLVHTFVRYDGPVCFRDRAGQANANNRCLMHGASISYFKPSRSSSISQLNNAT